MNTTYSPILMLDCNDEDLLSYSPCNPCYIAIEQSTIREILEHNSQVVKSMEEKMNLANQIMTRLIKAKQQDDLLQGSLPYYSSSSTLLPRNFK